SGRPLAALSAVVLLVAVLDPGTATGAGFVLSVSATAALVLAARATADRIRRPWMPGPVADVLAVCVVAHLATLPVLMLTGREARRGGRQARGRRGPARPGGAAPGPRGGAPAARRAPRATGSGRAGARAARRAGSPRSAARRRCGDRGAGGAAGRPPPGWAR